MPNIQQLESTVQQVRRDILRMVHKVNSGHPGGSLGCAEFFVALYQEVMIHDSNFKMNGTDEDLFFLLEYVLFSPQNQLYLQTALQGH